MFRENGSIPKKKSDGSDKLVDIKKNDQVWETVVAFNYEKENISLKTSWQERYKDNPLSFFSDENFQHLESLQGGERLNLLSLASLSILVTPELAEKYFRRFPDDREAVNQIFRSRNGMAEDTRDYYLFSISALSMDEEKSTHEERGRASVKLERNFKQYYDIARRRQEAPKILLSNYKDTSFNEEVAEFGEAAEQLFEAISKVNPGLPFAPEQMFTAGFEKLSEDDKAKFLHICLAKFHYFLLFTETYNSEFSPEFIARMKTYRNNDLPDYRHEAAHSMIYKTYQPSRSYETDQKYYDFKMSSTFWSGGDVEEYADHKMVLETLRRLKGVGARSTETAELVVDFWNKNRNPIFANAVSEVLSNQDVNTAGARLLELLHQSKDKKEPISAMLYRLEFGRIGISEEGVKYLEKIYDLGEYNQPGYHASRLTSQGEIGVFNEELALIKYFHLGELDTEEKKVKAKVMDFSYETLFIGRDSESAEERERREGYLTEFKSNYYQISEEKIQAVTGLSLNNLTFKEQGWFLIYFNQASEAEQAELLDFISRHGEDGIKSFLALDADPQLGRKLLHLSERLDSGSAAMVFRQLAETADLAELENEELKKLFFHEGREADIDWRTVRQGLLARTSQAISDFYDSNKVSLDDTLKLLKVVAKSRQEISLLSEVLKEAKRSGQAIESDSIKDMKLEIKDFGEKASEDDKSAIIQMARDNWSDFGNEAMKDIVLDGLEKSLSIDVSQKIYNLKYREEVVGTVRFEATPRGTVYAGSLNISPDLRGLALGYELMAKSLSRESEKQVLEATASIRIPAGCAYVEKIGFVADGVIEDYHGTGEMLFTICLDKEKNKEYELRPENKNHLLSGALAGAEIMRIAAGPESLEEMIGQPQIILRFDVEEEYDKYKEALRQLLPKVGDNLERLEGRSDKYTMTRYFYDKVNDPQGHVRYMVFEKNFSRLAMSA